MTQVNNTTALVKNYIAENIEEMIENLDWNVEENDADASMMVEAEDGLYLTLTAKVSYEARTSSDKEECWGHIYNTDYTVLQGCSCYELDLEVETEDGYECISLLDEFGKDVEDAFKEVIQG